MSRFGNSPYYIFAIVMCGLHFSTPIAHAEVSSSPSFKIDAIVGNSFGGTSSSSSFGMVGSGGESIAGNGSSGSFVLGAGYVPRLDESIQLTINSSAVLGTLSPGTSKQVDILATMQSLSPYSLAAQQDHDLQSGANTIPSVSGSIASPSPWAEGTTKGLGFSLLATNATAIPAKWDTGGSYAAFPNTSTAFYDRTGMSSGADDTLSLRLRADILTSQAIGTYSNIITWTMTTTP